MATAPLIPMIADKNELQQTLHTLLGSACDHSKTAPTCLVCTVGLLGVGVVTTQPKFIEKMKDNVAVQEILKDAMAQAWDEGYREGCGLALIGDDDPTNPFKEESSSAE